MDISRKLGILVFFGVPAIIGGGIVYGAAGNYIAVAVYEIILYIIAGAIISKWATSPLGYRFRRITDQSSLTF